MSKIICNEIHELPEGKEALDVFARIHGIKKRARKPSSGHVKVCFAELDFDPNKHPEDYERIKARGLELAREEFKFISRMAFSGWYVVKGEDMITSEPFHDQNFDTGYFIVD